MSFGFFALRESLPEEKRDRQPLRLRDANPLASMSEFARRPSLGILLLVYVLFHFAFNGRNAIFSVFAIDAYRVSPAQLAMLFVVSGIGNIVVQGFLVGRLVPRFGEKALIGLSLITQALMFMGTYLVPAYWMQYPVSVLSTATAGLLWPTLTALIANTMPQHEQGKVSGVNTSLGGLMSVLGPLWAGVAYDQISPAAPFWTGAILLVIAWLFILGVRQTTTAAEPAVGTT